MQLKWGVWTRGTPQAELRNGYPLPWTNSKAAPEEIAAAIFVRIPYHIVGDVEWLVERAYKGSIPIYTLRIRGGQSPLELHQKDMPFQTSTIHGMSISHAGTINFAIGLDDRLSVVINLNASA
mgnify:FL=1